MSTEEEEICFTSLDFSDKDLEELPEIDSPDYVTVLNLSNNPIKSLKGFPQMPNLEELYLDSTDLANFEGAVELPNLKKLSIQGAPILEHKYFLFMALLAFGTQIKEINGRAVKDTVIEKAENLIQKYRQSVQNGEVIENFEEQDESKSEISTNSTPSKPKRTKSKPKRKPQRTPKMISAKDIDQDDLSFIMGQMPQNA